MLPFVSEESYNMHLEYVNSLRLKLSAVRKIRGAEDGKRKKCRGDTISDTEARIENELTLHEVYFNSFSEREFPRSAYAARIFGSESELLSKIYKIAKDVRWGFVGVAAYHGGRIEVFSSSDYGDIKGCGKPLLAIDVCEHAYFLDYGFDKDKYVRRALTYLSLDRLDVFS